MIGTRQAPAALCTLWEAWPGWWPGLAGGVAWLAATGGGSCRCVTRGWRARPRREGGRARHNQGRRARRGEAGGQGDKGPASISQRQCVGCGSEGRGGRGRDGRRRTLRAGKLGETAAGRAGRNNRRRQGDGRGWKGVHRNKHVGVHTEGRVEGLGFADRQGARSLPSRATRRRHAAVPPAPHGTHVGAVAAAPIKCLGL